MQIARFICCIIFICGALATKAACLNTPVNLDCTPCTIEEALDKLESQIDCSFSYSTDQLNPDQSITITVSDAPLLQVLERITSNEFKIRERSRYILMTRLKGVEKEKEEKSEFEINGMVRNAKTGTAISNATVYIVSNKSGTVSDQNGKYHLKLSSDQPTIGISYSRQSYFDTIIVVRTTGENINLDIDLIPRAEVPEKMPIRTLSQRPKEVEELTMVKFLVPEPQRQLALNLEFLENIPVQFSIIPSIGTNKFTSGAKRNLLSVNLLSGYNAGVEGLEVGGLVNINREDMIGLQAGGLANIVGGKVRGLQAGGIFNNVRGSVYGLQAGGVYNIVLDTIKGAQVAGVFNLLRGTVYGTQLSGVFNVATENMTGLQAAGFSNHTLKDVKFAQAAGFLNTAGSVSGAQIAGFTNVSSGEVNGVQVAGFLNTAKNITGAQVSGFMNASGDATTQVSGFINIGKRIEGTQIGILNFSDSSKMSVGILSFSLKGMNHIDFNTDLVQPYNLSYRTGSKYFYNILQVGYGSYVGLNLFSYGYGIGSQPMDPKKRLQPYFELMARQLMDFNNEEYPLNLNVRFDPGLSIRLFEKRPYLVFGPTFNMIISDGVLQNQNPDSGKTMAFRTSYPPIYDAVTSEVEVKFWVGARLGVRI